MITLDYVKSHMHFDPETGIFTWKVAPNRKPALMGKEVGCFNGAGYRLTRFEGTNYMLHRVAWLYVYGVWPTGILDHINGDRSDNRISNLRECTQTQNMMNRGKTVRNASGWKGVTWYKAGQKWHASIGVDGKTYHLGYFDDVKEAAEEYIFAAIKHFGEYARF